MIADRQKYNHIIHPIPPLYRADSKVLILGSFPSVKTREAGFFYGHPQNRFWRVLAAVFGEQLPETIPQKKEFLYRNKIALWDSIRECDIIGSSDASIKNAVPNDFSAILAKADICRIVTNGKKSHEIYRKYCLPVTGRSDLCLPSTSPANAAFSLDKLTKAWSVLAEAVRDREWEKPADWRAPR